MKRNGNHGADSGKGEWEKTKRLDEDVLTRSLEHVRVPQYNKPLHNHCQVQRAENKGGGG